MKIRLGWFCASQEKILEAGGSRDPDLVLKEVGIDMRDRNFWVNALGVVESWQKELEGL